MNKLHWLQQRLWLFSIPLALGLIWLVASEIGWDGLIQAIQKFSIPIWFLVSIFMFGSLSSQVFRSWILLKSDAPSLKLFQVGQAGLGAFTAGSLTPGRIGDAALVLLLPGTTAKSVGISLIDRLMYWPPMHLFGLVSFGFVLYPFYGTISIISSVLVCFGYLLVMEWVLIRTRKKEVPSTKNHFLYQLYEGFSTIPINTLRIGIVLGFVQYGFVAFQFVIALYAIGWKGNFATGLFLFGALQLVRSFIAVTPGNLGTSELVGMYLGGYLIDSKDLLPQVTLSLFLVNTALPALIGLPFWIKISKGLKKKS